MYWQHYLPENNIWCCFLAIWSFTFYCNGNACLFPKRQKERRFRREDQKGCAILDAPSNFDLILIHLYAPIHTKVGLSLECETHILQGKITNRSLVDVIFHDDNGGGSFSPW